MLLSSIEKKPLRAARDEVPFNCSAFFLKQKQHSTARKKSDCDFPTASGEPAAQTSMREAQFREERERPNLC